LSTAVSYTNTKSISEPCCDSRGWFCFAGIDTDSGQQSISVTFADEFSFSDTLAITCDLARANSISNAGGHAGSVSEKCL
jgi:hypothetical protein